MPVPKNYVKVDYVFKTNQSVTMSTRQSSI